MLIVRRRAEISADRPRHFIVLLERFANEIAHSLLVSATAMATSRGSFAGMRIAVDLILNGRLRCGSNEEGGGEHGRPESTGPPRPARDLTSRL